MKILKLRLKNLNSLKGDWDIDFTAAPFADNSLFAITGPTGAGKSTLLDAICLALYHRTPRLEAVSAGGNELMTRHTDFVVRNLFDMGPDYARTLAHWRQRFTHAWQDIEKLGFDERFRRMWLYYFGYCEAGFNARTISVVQLTAERV